ncbi:hypothetical protein BaRGS_00031665 [Batillaria attramentaria]|uniref:Uncharacterized protein n=1 Tax=Batillaria attramentaria TaxID=370345 RepID=A0ABD0JQ16_9CAEN
MAGADRSDLHASALTANGLPAPDSYVVMAPFAIRWRHRAAGASDGRDGAKPDDSEANVPNRCTWRATQTRARESSESAVIETAPGTALVNFTCQLHAPKFH